MKNPSFELVAIEWKWLITNWNENNIGARAAECGFTLVYGTPNEM